MPLKISALNCFGVCTDSQNRGNIADHHIYTSHYLWFEHGFLFLSRICFCRDSSLFCRHFSLFCRGFFFVLPSFFFILPWVFLCFAVSFLYLAVAFFILPWVFFVLPWVFFILPWVFFILPWVFFILSRFSLFCRECSLFCRDFGYVAMTLIILPWFCFSCRDSYGPPWIQAKLLQLLNKWSKI